MLEAVEGLIAERALVWARKIRAVLFGILHVVESHGHCHCGGGHRRAWLAIGLAGLPRRDAGGGLGVWRAGNGVAGLLESLNLRALWVQQV